MSHPKFKVITSRSNQGFFTQVFHTLQHLDAAEREGMVPIVYWSGGIYKQDGGYNGKQTRNVWDYFFEPVSEFSFDDMYPNAKANKYGDLRTYDPDMEFVSKFRNTSLSHEPVNCWNTKMFPPDICLVNPSFEGRSYVNSLINKYLKIRKIVLNKIESFYSQYMKDYQFACVHIRGCNDHQPAQGHKIMTRYLKKIDKYLQRNKNDKVFVATDYQGALDSVIRKFGDTIFYRSAAKRSQNQYALQYACQVKKKHRPPGAKVFEDVLIDAILLSRGKCLYRGFSNVASAATFFNPHIKSVYVPKYNEKDKEYLGIS